MTDRPFQIKNHMEAGGAHISPPGLFAPEIVLPRPGTDLFRWPVVACDQFTSEPEYWMETARLVGEAPSTLHMILPEIYLEHPGSLPVENRIRLINESMRRYLDDGTLQALPPGWILTDRATPLHASRKGLVAAIDLERYDFRPGSRELVRATEETVLERIPPRLAIRKDAPLELPHVQLLIDDPGRTVIEPLFESCRTGKPVYETPLMQGGGAVRSWHVPAGSPAFDGAACALGQLESVRRFSLLAAVGDGNHSLASAKAHWENIRPGAEPGHPARYALVELINIHDEGLAFEPIHRVLFGLAPEKFLEAAARWFADQDCSCAEIDPAAAYRSMSAGLDGGESHDAAFPAPAVQAIPVFFRSRAWMLLIRKPVHSLTAGSLQPFIDSLVRQEACRVDYVHGGDVVRRLTEGGAIGLLLPALDKAAFFSIISREGILPRKTFSMGEAREKRYYFECRRIT